MLRTVGPGTTIGHYRVEHLLGRGGMGVVFIAEQRPLGRRVALKVLAPELAEDETFRERFRHELGMAALIEHPNVVPVYEAGETDDVLFIAMRYVDGQDLKQLLTFEGPLQLERAAGLVAQIAGALDAAHARGVVHRDVKPANILVAGKPPTEHAYLTDFGLVKRLGSGASLTVSGQWLGTVDYVSPEQVSGLPVDARSDVYSLGCVLYAAVTGEVPYPRDSEVAKLYAHAHEPPPSLSGRRGIPAAFATVLERAMAKQPADRFPSAGDLGRAARAAVEGATVTAPERSVAVGRAAPRPEGVTAARTTAPLGEPPLDEQGAWDPPPPYVPQAAASEAPTIRRDTGRGVLAASIVVAAVIVVVGGVAAALIASGALKGGGGGKPEPGRSTPTSRPTPHVAAGFTRYSAPTYSADVPAGWSQTKDYEPQDGGTRFVSEWSRGSQRVKIDTQPNTSGSPRSSAESVRSSSNIRDTLSFRPDTIRGGNAFTWIFEYSGERRIDIFFFDGPNGYAVWGSAPPNEFSTIEPIVRRMADSLKAG